MNYLAENALPIWAAGAVAVTLALIVYLQTRTTESFLAIVVILAIAGVLLVTERLIETPREAVERTLYELADTVENNDVPGALRFLASTADTQIRTDIETLMPLVKIDRANVVGAPQIEVEPGDAPDSATVICRGIIVATLKQNGMKGGAEDELTMRWVRQGDRWLVEDYVAKRSWNRPVGR
ncbi:MAG TPA: hypothetical protein VGK58_13570 [Lacipirellulaceae bacterium]